MSNVSAFGTNINSVKNSGRTDEQIYSLAKSFVDSFQRKGDVIYRATTLKEGNPDQYKLPIGRKSMEQAVAEMNELYRNENKLS